MKINDFSKNNKKTRRSLKNIKKWIIEKYYLEKLKLIEKVLYETIRKRLFENEKMKKLFL
jgi:hypothetical protein